MRTKQDNWQSFDYENQRYLDTISRLLSFNGNGGCVSVVEYDDKVHVTTNYFGRYDPKNDKWKPNKKYEENFAQFANDLNILLVKKDINSFFEKVVLDGRHFYHGSLNQPSEDSLIMPQNFKEYFIALRKLYFQEINYNDVNSVKSYIRPMQDLLKIISLFNKAINLNYIGNGIPSMHAEMKHFQGADDKIDYYGLNKLSCDPCYSYINGKSRGTHPIKPNKWVDPKTGDIIDNKIIDKKQTLDEGQDLSDDEKFESKIDMSFLGLETSWYNFKKVIVNQVKSIVFQPLKDVFLKKQTDWIEGKQITTVLKKELGEVKILSKYHEASIDENLVEIDSVVALEQILHKVIFDPNFDRGILPFKVNGVTKKLNIAEQQTSHWVGLYIQKGLEKYLIKYVDPMGHPMSDQVMKCIQDILLNVDVNQPMNGTTKTHIEEVGDKHLLVLTKGIQYVCYDKSGISFTDDSNINDCGVFITMLLIMLWKDQEIPQVHLNQLESCNFGQELRITFQLATELIEKKQLDDDIDIFDHNMDKQEFKGVGELGKTDTFKDECD